MTDFHDAHERHWQDAELLYKENRYANADHLYGFAAECGLKQLMLVFGMQMQGGSLMEKDKVHADKIWARYETYRNGYGRGARYALTSPNLFADWNASQRYYHHSHFTQKSVETHKAGANAVRQLIKRAQYEGLIP